MLAFVLTPSVRWLERRIPTVAALQAGGGGRVARVEVMVARIAEGLEKKVAPDDVPVQMIPARASRATHLWDLFSPLAEPVITVLFVVVLCIFMLGRRDDLRSRLISLVGSESVTTTTRAVDEGAQRITQYLRDQTQINAVFGLAVGMGLWLIGVLYFVLWGVVAALARFVPYLGAKASMLLPAALAFAIFPGWARAALTVGLFVGMDRITACAVESVRIGQRTGVSSISLPGTWSGRRSRRKTRWSSRPGRGHRRTAPAERRWCSVPLTGRCPVPGEAPSRQRPPAASSAAA